MPAENALLLQKTWKDLFVWRQQHQQGSWDKEGFPCRQSEQAQMRVEHCQDNKEEEEEEEEEEE